ncbi:cob(I)yrinic acid a,c-diamide adenosyltransferase [Dongshaea marina]|uniref:cob(I)yrinic acid a,c-diamide adenosyltransferase n=1 Tax=Dongshaea marina TaxID=2047966 RepID=UPI000D3EC20F|nr:cob(I)yrinic acid a,c-diamide adenosyltransferase [Dongshaea marina]
MKIYTRGGDQGKTSLVGGPRVEKDCLHIEIVGQLDELNSFIGLMLAHLPEGSEDIQAIVSRIQHQIFDAGAQVATVGERQSCQVELSWVEALEQMIDRLSGELPPLRHFVLPGGSKASSFAHVARAVARRAERALVRLHLEEPQSPELMSYLNRLSDLLFVIGRTLLAREAIPEVRWQSAMERG